MTSDGDDGWRWGKFDAGWGGVGVGGSKQSGQLCVLGNTREIELREGREGPESFSKDSCTR